MVYDHDQHNAKGIGMPLTWEGMAEGTRHALFVINFKDETRFNKAAKKIFVLEFNAVVSGLSSNLYLYHLQIQRIH